MTATKEKELTEITVPIPLEQLEAVHQVWIEFASILTIADRNKCDSIMNLLEPLDKRLGDVICEEWEGLMDKAKKNGGFE